MTELRWETAADVDKGWCLHCQQWKPIHDIGRFYGRCSEKCQTAHRATIAAEGRTPW